MSYPNYSDLKEKVSLLEAQISKLETDAKIKYDSIGKLEIEKAEDKCVIENYQSECSAISKRVESLETQLSEITEKLNKSQEEYSKSILVQENVLKENEKLTTKLKEYESKLYKLGQSEQTIHLNKPKEFKYYNSLQGLEYDNPCYLKKILSKVPTLYEFDFMGLDKIYPEYKIKWMKASKEYEESEDFKRKTAIPLPPIKEKSTTDNSNSENNTKSDGPPPRKNLNVQIPFVYETLNASYLTSNIPYLPNNYFDICSLAKTFETRSKISILQ